MGFWRKELIDFALDQDSDREMAAQKAWIAAEPRNAQPYYHLAMLLRTRQRRDEALGLLLHAVSLNPQLTAAHIALAEMYAVEGDLARARHHADCAESLGDPQAAEQLRRHDRLTPDREPD